MKFAFRRSLWHGRSSSGFDRKASSIRRPIAAASSYSGGIATPRASASARYASTIRSGTKRPGIGGPVVDPPERLRDARGSSGLMDGLVADPRAHDELRDEIALGPDERRHLRPDPDAGRRDRRRVLDLAADPEQVGVVAGEPDDAAIRRFRPARQRKLRLVIPPVSGGSVRSTPASSGTRCMAATSLSRSSPRTTSPTGGPVMNPPLRGEAARRSLDAPPDPR